MAALIMPLTTVSGRIRGTNAMPTRRGAMPRMNAVRRAMRGRRWPMAGLLVMGAVAGTAGVMALRRRRQGEWEAYDPAADLAVVRGGDGAAIADRQPAGPAATGPTAGHRTGDTTGSATAAKPTGAAKPNGTAKPAGAIRSNGQASVGAKASATVPSATADKGSGPGTP